VRTLFDRQSMLLIARMRAAEPGNILTLAHTLRVRRAHRRWRVARAAEALEVATPPGSRRRSSRCLGDRRTRAVIAEFA